MSKGGFMGAYSNMTLTLSMYAGANKEYTICSAQTIKSTSDSWRSSSDTSPVKSGITVTGTFNAPNLSGDVPVWFITERTNGTTIGSGEVTNSSYTMKFPAKQYTITYEANGGTGGPSSQTFNYNSGEKISTQIPTKTGYTFIAWQRKDATTYTFSPGASIPYDWGSFTLVAQWTINQYTVTYDANAGINAPQAQTGNYGYSLHITNEQPTKTGYEFTGWNTAIDGSGVWYYPGDYYNNSVSITLYAQWQLSYCVNIGNTWVPCEVKVRTIGEGYVFLRYTSYYRDLQEFAEFIYDNYGFYIQDDSSMFYIARGEYPPRGKLDDVINDDSIWGQDAYGINDYDLYMKLDNVKQWVDCEIRSIN